MANPQLTAEYTEVEGEIDTNAPHDAFDDFALNDPGAEADLFTDLVEYQARPVHMLTLSRHLDGHRILNMRI